MMRLRRSTLSNNDRCIKECGSSEDDMIPPNEPVPAQIEHRIRSSGVIDGNSLKLNGPPHVPSGAPLSFSMVRPGDTFRKHDYRMTSDPDNYGNALYKHMGSTKMLPSEIGEHQALIAAANPANGSISEPHPKRFQIDSDLSKAHNQSFSKNTVQSANSFRRHDGSPMDGSTLTQKQQDGRYFLTGTKLSKIHSYLNMSHDNSYVYQGPSMPQLIYKKDLVARHRNARTNPTGQASRSHGVFFATQPSICAP